MHKIFDFETQYKKQKEFYAAFVSYIKERTNVLSITEANKEEESRGIDFWAVMVGGENVPIEVKCDFWLNQTGNIAVETVSNATYESSGPGWLFKLHNVKLLAIINPETGEFYLLDSRIFFWRVLEYMKTYRTFSAHNKNRDTDEEWWSIGVLMPLNILSECIVDKGNIYNLRSGDNVLLTYDHNNEVPNEDEGSIPG